MYYTTCFSPFWQLWNKCQWSGWKALLLIGFKIWKINCQKLLLNYSERWSRVLLRLTVHLLTCSICGELFNTRHEFKSCFFFHLVYITDGEGERKMNTRKLYINCSNFVIVQLIRIVSNQTDLKHTFICNIDKTLYQVVLKSFR